MIQAPCASSRNNVKNVDQALKCESCGLREHLSCMREPDKPSEELNILLCQSQCNALWAVCSICHSQGSVTKKLYELESKTLVLEERLHTNELLLQEEECLVDHLQRELLEARTDRDRILQLFEKQKMSYRKSRMGRRKESHKRLNSHHILTSQHSSSQYNSSLFL